MRKIRRKKRKRRRGVKGQGDERGGIREGKRTAIQTEERDARRKGKKGKSKIK